ncbi:FAD-dependent oxidoreductase [Plastorhodobacter daqingensis]|uniref:FAD-dependent oxidoreductase n=1 Tax=Plastorhodobacter daqingensis TaxID=1387281 RepID=A0ABW2UPF7_9RHOB
MTDEARVLVVGAGAAGLAAAVALTEAGLPVKVVDQARAPGGAVHRQPLPGGRGAGTAEHKRSFAALLKKVHAAGIEITCETGFAGLDHTGTALLTGEGAGLLRPRGLVLATGARELVQPRLGWTLPGVQTAGALQTRLKTLGVAPQGRILLAGNGPLLLAVGAELAALGNPPIVIALGGRPFSLRGMRLPLPYQIEAARHLARLLAARVPVLTGAHLCAISRHDDMLTARIRTRRGLREFHADLLGLHDGIRPNDIGFAGNSPIPVEHAGDCREALGARAALADGRRAGLALSAQLLGKPAPAPCPDVARERAAQQRLAALFAPVDVPPLADLPADTILCRCEGRTLGDLRALGPTPTVRQLRLTGRFAMGACQGRFCAEWVTRLAGRNDLGLARMPLRPVPIADLLTLPDTSDGDLA